MTNKLMLEVIEADKDYAGKNVVTLSDKEMDEIGISSGDIVKVSGEKELYFRAIRSNDEEGTIGIDGVARSVLGVSVGAKVAVDKSEKLNDLNSITLSILPHEEISNEQLKSYNAQLKQGSVFKNLLIDSPISIGQKISVPTNVGKFTYVVSKVLPKKNPFGLVGDETKIEIAEDVGEGSGVSVYYEDIGGLKEEIEKIREMVEFPMKHPDILN